MSHSLTTRVVKANFLDGQGEQYVKKIELDIVDDDHMYRGWDNNGTDTQYGGGQTGKRTIWDYSSYPTLTPFVYPLSIAQDSLSGYYGNSYPKTRDGGSYKIKHMSNKGSSTSFSDSYPNLELPTFSIGISDDSVINLNKNTTYAYDEWFRTAETNDSCAQVGIYIYKRPYVADQTMTVTSSTTANQFYPENSSQFVVLKQPTIYASIGIVDDITTMALTSYSSVSPLWGTVGTPYPFWVKVIIYKPDWDGVSSASMSWNVTGAKAGQCSAQSGTITSFSDIPNATGGWVNYAVGYFPFTLSTGANLASSDLTFNIVANGLKFDSGTQTKVVAVTG